MQKIRRNGKECPNVKMITNKNTLILLQLEGAQIARYPSLIFNTIFIYESRLLLQDCDNMIIPIYTILNPKLHMFRAPIEARN